jgi:hypothetical protein
MLQDDELRQPTVEEIAGILSRGAFAEFLFPVVRCRPGRRGFKAIEGKFATGSELRMSSNRMSILRRFPNRRSRAVRLIMLDSA